MSDFAYSLLNRINYHKTIHSSENAVNNLKSTSPKLNEMNILTLAYLSQNDAISDEERKIFLECVKATATKEYEMWQKELSRRRSQDC
jgi:hypothetical protein